MDSAHRNSLQPGHLVHWYKIVKILGQGGFGITYLAVDTNLNQKVAIKEYLPIELAVRDSNNSLYPISDDREHQFSWGLERFIAEAQTLAKFDHHNIVRVLTVFEANNTGYMLMRYEEGESLQDILKAKKTLDEKTLKNILFPILDGLEKVHAAGFIHRDIKPANIYIRSNGTPVLLDFGAARQSLGEETKTLTSMVSSGYAPFEQYFSKSDQQGPWTDIYGLGATMYRGITSKLPIDAVDRSNTILQLSEDTLVSASEIGSGQYTDSFLKSVDHALEFKYQDRPQSISEWLKELKNESEISKKGPIEKKNQEDVLTKVAKPQTEVSKGKKNPSKILGVILFTIVIIMVSLIYLYNNPEILLDKEQLEEAPLTAQEELELKRKELLLLEKKAEEEKAREEELVRLKAERERKVAEEKARKIKEEADKQKKIESLLTSAEEDINANRLVSPKDNNAYEKYKKVLELSLEHTGANEGIARIGNIFISESQLAIDSKDFKRATKLLAEANKIIPDTKLLKDKQQILSAAIEKEKIEEEKRIAAENARKIKEEKQQKIKDLLIKADLNIKAGQLVSPEDNNAYLNYKDVLKISSEHTGASDGLLNISKLLITSIQAEIDKKDFNEADKKLKEAEGYFPGADSIIEIKNELVAAKLEDEKERARLAEEKRIAAEKAIKLEEEKQLKVKELLGQAKLDIEEKRLIEPLDGNALDTYKEVLELSPDNEIAKKGIIKVANALVEEAKIAIGKNDFVEAENWLTEAGKITPDSKEIKEASQLLDTARLIVKQDKAKKLLVQANESIDKNELKVAEELLAEAKDLDSDSKELKITQKRYNEITLKQQEEQKRAQEIKQLLSNAQSNIDENKLTTPEGNNALAQFRKVIEYEPTNEEAKSGIKNIFNRYLELAEKANKAEDYEKSQEYLNKANKIIPDDDSVLTLMNTLKPKIAEIEKQRKETVEKAKKKQLEKEAELKRLAEQQRLEKEAEQKRLEEEKQAEIKRLAEEAEKAKSSTVGEFIEIPGGTFNINGKDVTVDKFKLAKQMITIGQWKKVMGASNVSNDKCDDCAITTITRQMAFEFIDKLNSSTKQSYRLPTAAEWLYACKKGGSKKECDGRNISAAYIPSGDLVNVKSEKIDQLGIQGMGGKTYEMTCSKYGEKYIPEWEKCLDRSDTYISTSFGSKKNMDTVSYGYWQQNVHNHKKVINTGFRLVLD
jgi:serine/threonine protein kinase/formylglycine-generating enzyme required for sulfatase activity